MKGTRYNILAGQNLERLAALSDGVFAVAMTLLVLDLHAPVASAIHSERELGHALLEIAPRLLIYLLSFMTLGIFWMGQQAQLNALARGNRDLAWVQLGFLAAVTITPFSTALMAEFITFRAALLIYWVNILLLGVMLYVSWRVALRANLIDSGEAAELGHAVERRIIIAQSLYAFGAALCVFSPYFSIGFIVLVQLNYVIAPRIGFLRRL
jgi:uncharacterized membrane protein